MSSAALAAAALLGGLAAWAGTVLGGRLCRDVVPYADGPAAVAITRWPFVAAGAALGAGAGLHGWPLLHFGWAALAIAALAACAACDLRCGMLPDVCTLGMLVGGIASIVCRHDPWAALGVAAVGLPFAALALLTGGRGMGWGDAKLAAAGGALLGFGGALAACALAALVAAAFAWRGGAMRRPIAFGPYLAGSIALALVGSPA